MVLIIYCGDVVNEYSYQGIVRHLLGPYWFGCANMVIVIHNMGCCITYLLVVADQIDQGELQSQNPVLSYKVTGECACVLCVCMRGCVCVCGGGGGYVRFCGGGGGMRGPGDQLFNKRPQDHALIGSDK